MSQSTPTQHEIDVYAGEYVLTGDKSKSWRKTFPNSKAKPAAVAVSANRMHNLPNVLLRIDELRVRTAENDAEEFDISYEAQVKRCLEILALGTKPKYDQAGNEIAQNLAAAQAAVNEINKMAGHHAAIKNELTGKGGEPLQINITDKDSKL